MAPQLSSSSTSLSSLLPQSLSSLFLFKIKPVQLAIEIFLFCFFFSPSQLNLFKVIQFAIEFFLFLFLFHNWTYSACDRFFILFFFFLGWVKLNLSNLQLKLTLTCIHLWVSPCFSFLSRQRTWFCFSILWCNWVGPSPTKERLG